MRRLLIALALLTFAVPAAAQWVDNGNDTHSLTVTEDSRYWTLVAAQLVMGKKAPECTQARIDADLCPASALGERFPVIRDKPCKSVDVPDVCVSEDDNYAPDLVRCGDGTYSGGTGDRYEVFSKGEVRLNENCTGLNTPWNCCDGAGTGTCPPNAATRVTDAVYQTICKSGWKTKGLWVPHFDDAKLVISRQGNRQRKAQITGDSGGEARILVQTADILEETGD